MKLHFVSARVKGLLRRNSPFNQNLAMGIMLFCLPGIYTALTGLGAGGGRSTSSVVASQTNAILYGVFAGVAWFGGSLLNLIKLKYSLMFGSLGYPLYVGGLWYFDRTGNEWFPLWGGAMLGVTAGFLWTSSAFIQFAYAEEKDKAKYIAIQWMLKSVGATVGASIALGANIDQTAAVGVSNTVYIVFIIIHCSAFFIAWIFIVDPRDVVRNDGTHIAIFRDSNYFKDLKVLLKLSCDRRILILVPAMFVCEMALGLVSAVNARWFNLRTRAVNNLCYQVIQFLFPAFLLIVLDTSRIKSRRIRGCIGVLIMGAVAISAAAGLAGWIKVYRLDELTKAAGTDWTDPSFPGLFVIYVLFGGIYSGYQLVVEYVLSSLSNDPAMIAPMSGIIRGLSSLGMCVSFSFNTAKVKFFTQTLVQLVLYTIGVVGMLYVMIRDIKETNYFVEKDVIVPRVLGNTTTIDTTDKEDNSTMKEGKTEIIL